MSETIIAILPAYNAANTLIDFLNSLPQDFFDEIILVDDCSSDNTYEIAKKQKGIEVYKTPRNLGYGGNLKTCLSLALEKGADIIVELHPDGEYGTDGILPAIAKINKGSMLVLGNRFSRQSVSLGMFFWKSVSTRILTCINNLIFGTHIPDMHQGFRVYTQSLLKAIPFRANSNDYIFSFELIAQAISKKMQIDSAPVSSFYTGRKRGASFKASVIYALGTFRVIIMFLLSHLGFKLNLFGSSKEPAICPNCNSHFLVEKIRAVSKYSVFFCKGCMNGFTYPNSQGLSYYPQNYWVVSGFSGFLKKIVFGFSQKRRKNWLMRLLDKGLVLDVGCGEGDFGRSLDKNFFTIYSLESPLAKIKNNNVIKKDFLKWQTSHKYNAIVFWESLEHVDYPQKYLQKATNILKKGGYILIEYPRFNCLESAIFGNNWFHLDLPRHLSHLTDKGIRIIAKRLGLDVVDHKGVLSLDYAPYGFLVSALGGFGEKMLGKFKRDLHPLYSFFLAPFFVLSVFIEVFLFIIGESPIGFIALRKGIDENKQLQTV